MGADREQFKNDFRVTVEGIEILIPQKQLHSVINGKIINYTGTWWEILLNCNLTSQPNRRRKAARLVSNVRRNTKNKEKITCQNHVYLLVLHITI